MKQIMIPINDKMNAMIFDSKNIVHNSSNINDVVNNLIAQNISLGVNNSIKDKNYNKISVNTNVTKNKFYKFFDPGTIIKSNPSDYDFIALEDGINNSVVSVYYKSNIIKLSKDNTFEVGEYYLYNSTSDIFYKKTEGTNIKSNYIAISNYELLKIN